MTEPVNLAAARAEKKKDGSLWTPRDCLQQLLADIDAGEVNPTKLCIHMLTDEGTGFRHNFYQANLTRIEHIALLAVAQQGAVTDWQV